MIFESAGRFTSWATLFPIAILSISLVYGDYTLYIYTINIQRKLPIFIYFLIEHYLGNEKNFNSRIKKLLILKFFLYMFFVVSFLIVY